MIPDEEIERVRQAVDIVSVLGEYVPLKRRGSTFRGPCPFHQGKNPNFSVDPRRRIYHCFKCGESGDVFTFLQKRLGVDWPTSLRMTAQRMGIELREVQSRRDGPDPREQHWEVNAAAQEYFARSLWEEEHGAGARAYLAQREISREVAVRHGLGFAPREPSLLRTHLADLGFNDERQLEAGILVRREEGGPPRARFRGRLMFPIFDVSERVVGFGGRLLERGEPKYLNSPESPAFVKGKLLYGLNWARNGIRRADRAFLVEGYFDLIRIAAAGIEEVVAPLGTAMTTDQAELITRYSKNVFLLYDSDKAGLKATFRTGDELLRHGASVRVVSLPSAEDPDSYVRVAGKEGLERQIGQALDILERKIQLLQRGAWFSDLHRRRRAIDLLLPTMRAASDPLTRDMYIGRAAEASGVDRRVLADEVSLPEDDSRSRRVMPREAQIQHRRAFPDERTTHKPIRPFRRPGARDAAERELVRVMLTMRATIERVGERLGPEQFQDARYREIFEVLTELGPDATNEQLAGALSRDATSALDALVAEPDAVLDAERTLHDCLTQLELLRLQEENAGLQRLMSAATEDEKDRLVQSKQANVEEIQRLTQSRSVT